MRGRLARASMLLLATAGCSLTAEVVDVPTGAALAMIVVTVPENGAAELLAVALDREPSTLVSLPARGTGKRTIYALRYTCGLAALALTEGSLALAASSGRKLPLPASTILTTAEGASFAAWSPSPELMPAELAALEIADDGVMPSTRCLDVEVSAPIVIPQTREDGIVTATSLGGDEALLATGEGRFFRVSPAGLTQLTELSTSTPHHAAFRRDDGELWLVGADGRVVRGDLARGFTPAPGTNTNYARAWISGSPSGPLELYLLWGHRGVEYFDGTRWTVLESEPNGPVHVGNIAWLEPGKALAVGPTLRDVSHYTGGQVTHQMIASLNATDFPTAVAGTQFGQIVGTDGGDLFKFSEGAWRSLGSNPSRRIYAILPAGDGILAGGYGGYFRQYHLGDETCAELQYANDSVRLSVVLETRHLVIARTSTDEVALFFSFEPRSDACPGAN